jgi:hypothetical protein
MCSSTGYFVEVVNAAGVRSLRAGCGDASVPTASMGVCGEDCPCLVISACGDGSASLVLTTSCAAPVTPAWFGMASYVDGNGRGVQMGTASGTASNLPATTGDLTGSYTAQFVAADGTQTQISGSYCVAFTRM